MYLKINIFRIKKIIFTIILLLSTINIFYANEAIKKNGVLFYEQCNILLDMSDKKNIAKLGENLCIFIKKDNSDTFLILAKKKNNFSLELIDEETINYMKKNYYRGEKININILWDNKKIINLLKFNSNFLEKYNTIEKGYKIKFLEDNLLENFNILKKNCFFNSYFPLCKDNSKQKITEKIEKVFRWNVFNIEKLLNSNILNLKNEINKINKIKNKIKKINIYYTNKQKNTDKKVYSEKIKFTINFLIYKLEIYNKILENRAWDLEFNSFLKKNKIYFIDKELVWNLYISQNNYFTFFYYWDKRINALKNSISHFDEDELNADLKIKQENIEYLKQKIIEKYSAKFIEGTEKRLILITKKYLSKTKYLLFDTDNNKIFTFNWDIQKIEKGKKWYYMLVKKYNGEQFFILYDWKKLQIIVETKNKYNIPKFELLIWKKVKIYYYLDNWEKGIEEIDISKY